MRPASPWPLRSPAKRPASPPVIDTTAAVRLVKEGEGFKIDRIALTMEANVPGIDEAKFQELAEGAKKGCPLSKALAAVPEITLDANLRS